MAHYYLSNSEKSLQIKINQIFEKNNISAVRNIDKQAKQDVEKKKYELRMLVGNRYRDLIDSADSILEMKNSSNKISNHLQNIENFSEKLQSATREPFSQKISSKNIIINENIIDNRNKSKINNNNNNEEENKVIEIAKQVKELVDTPEKIWVALEQQEFLKASQLYLSAQNTHHLLLQSSSSQKLIKSIPLLSRQWTTVSQFPSKIKNSCSNFILQNNLSDAQYAQALCSLILLGHFTIDNAFIEFVKARKESLNTISDYLRNLKESESTISIVTGKLCELVNILYNTPFQIASIFLSANYNDNIIDDNNNNRSSIMSNLLNESKLYYKSVQHISISFTDICTKWLGECKDILQIVNQKCILHSIGKAKDLSQLEEEIWNIISAQNINEKWNSISQLLFHKKIDLWCEIFQHIFSFQSKVIIDKWFSQISIDSLLQSTFNQIQKDCQIQSQSSNTSSSTSSISFNILEKTQFWSIGSYVWDQVEQESIEAIKNRSFGITPAMKSITQSFDDQLKLLINDVQFLLSSNEISKQNVNENSYLQKKKALGTSTKANDIAALQTYLQEAFYSFASNIANSFGDQISAISKTLSNQNNEQIVQLIQKILFIGRLSVSISETSQQLPEIFTTNNSNNARSNNFKNSPISPAIRSKILPQSENPLKKKLQLNFYSQFLKSFIIWTDVISNDLFLLFNQKLLEENWSNAKLRKKTWEEVEISVDGEEGDQAKEVVQLPFQSSPFITSFLYRACHSIHNIAAHTLDEVPLRLYAQVLTSRLIQIYQKFLVEKKEVLCRESYMQLLFDVRFLFDVLGGRFDSKDNWPESLLSIFSQLDPSDVPNLIIDSYLSKKVLLLLKSIKSQLDPIDLAFFEPLLENYVQKCYQRSSISFGYLIQLNKLKMPIKLQNSAQEKHNILPLVSSVPRFPLLPISSK